MSTEVTEEAEELQDLLAQDGFTHYNSGKVREIFGDAPEFENAENLILVSTDRISAYDVVMRERIPGKGKVLNLMSAFWFDWFERNIGVRNHLIDPDFLDGAYAGRASLVQKLQPLPIECIARGLITGSFWSAFKKAEAVDGIKVVQGFEVPADMLESALFPEPLFTPTTKAEVGHDEALTLDEARALLKEKLGFDPIDDLEERTLDAFKRARDYARDCGIILADTKLEFGLDERNAIVWADEAFTPDSSRFSFVEDHEPGKKLVCQDKQILRNWLDAQGWDQESPPPTLPDELIQEIKGVYESMYERIVGEPVPS
jgi:phosphoribosylaminoimidazole-succinocarboxamide synthase